MLRVGLIGCGLIAYRHANAVREIAQRSDLPVRLEGVCDIDHDRADAYAAGFDVPAFYQHDALLDRVDAVFVCTPTDSHLELVEAAAGAGVAVFCEKPLGRDLEEARAVAAAARSVPNQVGLVLRSTAPYAAVASLLPDIGEPMAVVFRDDQFWPLEAHYGSSWRADRLRVGSGVLLEHSIHDVDLIHHLFGEVGTVSAVIRNLAGRPGVEDAVVALLAVTDGPVVTLTTLWHDIFERRSNRYLEVFGRTGRIRTEADLWGPVEIQDERGPAVQLPADEVAGRAAEWWGLDDTAADLLRLGPLEDYWFLQALVEGRQPGPSVDVALDAHVVVDEIYRVAEPG